MTTGQQPSHVLLAEDETLVGPRLERLPIPDWTRDGETWRVQPETAVDWFVDDGDVPCDLCRREHRYSASVAGIALRSGEYRGYCADHLREQRIWIENGRVVSWRLSR